MTTPNVDSSHNSQLRTLPRNKPSFLARQRAYRRPAGKPTFTPYGLTVWSSDQQPGDYALVKSADAEFLLVDVAKDSAWIDAATGEPVDRATYRPFGAVISERASV